LHRIKRPYFYHLQTDRNISRPSWRECVTRMLALMVGSKGTCRLRFQCGAGEGTRLVVPRRSWCGGRQFFLKKLVTAISSPPGCAASRPSLDFSERCLACARSRGQFSWLKTWRPRESSRSASVKKRNTSNSDARRRLSAAMSSSGRHAAAMSSLAEQARPIWASLCSIETPD
jgi:hypothetical protein